MCAKKVFVMPAVTPFSNGLLKAYVARYNGILSANMSAAGRENQTKELAPVIEKLANDNLYKKAKEIMTETDWSALCKTVAYVNPENGEGIEQVKVLVKLYDVIEHIAQGIRPKSTNFNVVIQAILKNGNQANISEIIASQSKKANVEFAHKMREAFTIRPADYTVGTATSQGSQVRQVLRLLGFAKAVKNQRDDNLTMYQYGIDVLTPVYTVLKDK